MDAFEMSDNTVGGPVKQESKSMNLIRCCFAEFIGDLIFVFIGSLQDTSGVQGAIGPAFAHGLTIFLLVVAMGHISGGHFNPAVTLGVLVSGNIGVLPAILYMISQLTGGFIGSLFARAVCSASTKSPLYYEAVLSGALTLPSQDINAGQGIFGEAILTFLLVTTVLLAAVDSDGNNMLAALAIGSCLIVDIIAGGNLTGASMNPARSLGPSIVYSIFGHSPSIAWRMHYIYWVGPGVGAILAACSYKLLLAQPRKRWFGSKMSYVGPQTVLPIAQVSAHMPPPAPEQKF